MKILLVTPSYYPITGGSEALTRTLSRKLVDGGFHADILTLNMNKKWNPEWRGEIVEEGGVNIFKIPAINPLPHLPNPLYTFFRINVLPKFTFVNMLKNYDIIHFISESDLSLPFLSRVIEKAKIMHCLGIFRGGGIYHYYMFKRPYFKKIFMRFFLNLADVFIVYPYEEKQILSELGVPSSKIAVLPLGIDINIFKKGKERKAENWILFVGRIDRIKGLHILLSALQHIKTPTRLIVIGPKWDENYYKEIEKMTLKINSDGIHSVKMLGPVERDELVYWYRKTSVLVTPYLYETYSYVTLEALACGTPVISTGTHISGDHSDGIVTVPKDPLSLARAIEELLGDKHLREKNGCDGRKFIEIYFSWESVIQKLKNIYLNLLTNKSMRHRS
ncbi:MAG: glycosyltransferase family 4 protein [Candidatus Bathyarchaeia archaeon]